MARAGLGIGVRELDKDAEEAGAAPAGVPSKVRMSDENRYQQRNAAGRSVIRITSISICSPILPIEGLRRINP